MFIVTNKAEVSRRIQRNRLIFWLGVGCLVGSMGSLLIGANPAAASIVFIVGYPLLAAGVLLSKRGSFNNRRFGVGGYKLRSEEVLIDEALKGVPPRYHLYNYVDVGGIIIEHLLVTPIGLMLIAVKPHAGKVKVGHDNYRRKNKIITSIGTFGEPGLGNPSRELGVQVKKVRAWFEQQGYDLPTDGVVVFPYAEIIGGEEMSFPVCHMNDLRQAIRGWGTELLMSADEQREIEKLLVKQLPASAVQEAQDMLDMPPAKRAALAAAAEREQAEQARLAKEKKTGGKKKDKEPVAAATAVATKSRPAAPAANPTAQPNPYSPQRLGLNGKPLPPKVAREKPRKRDVAPMPKVNPGAFGDTDKKK